MLGETGDMVRVQVKELRRGLGDDILYEMWKNKIL